MRLLLVSALGFGIACQAALAAEPACGSFTLVGGDKGINVVDNPPAGKSPGDLRAGWRRLADEAGRPVATVHYVAVLTEPDAEGGDILAGDYFIRLTDGYLAAHTVYQLPDAAEKTQGARNAILVVTGGTGPFANARGTVEIVAGEAPRYVFALSCG